MAIDADITLPVPFMSSRTMPAASMELPLLVCEAYGTVGWHASMELPMLEMEAHTAMRASMELPGFSIDATSIRGALVSADIRLPRLGISATSSTPVLGVVDINLPTPILRATSVHNILATGEMSFPTLWLSGLTSLEDGVVTGYAINLKTLGLSEYENFTFNSMCTIGGISFGGSSLGLFKLEGDTDDGKLVSGSIEFPLTDFGVDNKKRMRSIYFGGKADGSMRLFIENDEGNERRRVFSPRDIRSKTKIPVGRKGKGSYWKIKITNVRGCDFKLDTLEMFPIILERV